MPQKVQLAKTKRFKNSCKNASKQPKMGPKYVRQLKKISQPFSKHFALANSTKKVLEMQ